LEPGLGFETDFDCRDAKLRAIPEKSEFCNEKSSFHHRAATQLAVNSKPANDLRAALAQHAKRKNQNSPGPGTFCVRTRNYRRNSLPRGRAIAWRRDASFDL
jgi:hypothetical protein